MSEQFTSGKFALAECDQCGFQYKLHALREVIRKQKPTGLMVCRSCWEEDHPQNMVGMYPVRDPQAVRGARPDSSLGPGGSRDTQWGWGPVGLNNPLGLTGLNNDLEAVGCLGTVTVETT
jgi:hypothetical protein